MLVTLWTSRGEQIDLNLREDVTIGQLRQTLVNEFSYAPNVQIMYSTRVCRDDASVDDYPPGTLIVIGQRNTAPAPAPQYHNTSAGTAYSPYAQHGSSGGTTLRTGHSGGMRQAAEKKYANDYSAAANGIRGGNVNTQQQPSAYGGTTGYGGYGSGGMSGAYPPHNQSPLTQNNSSATTGNSYANYMSSAANRGLQSPPQGNMGGWGNNSAGVNNNTYGGSANNRVPNNTATSYQQQQQQQPTGGYTQNNFVPPPNVFGTAASTPQRSPAATTLPPINASHTNSYSSPLPATTANNAAPTTASQQRARTSPKGSYSSPPPQQRQTPQQQQTPTMTTTEGEGSGEPTFPDITLTATIIGQGPEKVVTIPINGGATVSELVSELVELAPQVGASIHPSQDSTKLMFFNKYINNWSDPIRKVPLVDGAAFLVCTGIYVDDIQMTLHSAERAMDLVNNALAECRANGETPVPSNKRNYWNEQLMKALLNLDSLQGVEEDVRLRRKQLVREVSALQDSLSSV